MSPAPPQRWLKKREFRVDEDRGERWASCAVAARAINYARGTVGSAGRGLSFSSGYEHSVQVSTRNGVDRGRHRREQILCVGEELFPTGELSTMDTRSRAPERADPSNDFCLQPAAAQRREAILRVRYEACGRGTWSSHPVRSAKVMSTHARLTMARTAALALGGGDTGVPTISICGEPAS